MDLIKLAVKVSEIVRDAGAAIMKIYEQEDDFQVENKSDNSPLTIADRAANQVINEGLKKLADQFPVISEENKAIPYAKRKNYDYFWLVDPLDGTKEFIKRNGEFTVNVALVKAGAPVLGVVGVPARGELYWGVRNAGAFEVRNHDVEKLIAARFRLSDPGLKVVCSRSHLNAETEAFIKNLKEPELVSQGSALKFIVLARGEAQLYPRLAPTMEWDTGAAQLILEEAGGSVIAEDSEEPLRYNKENLLNPHFIAYGRRID